MTTAKLKNILTGEIIDVHATTDSPDSSYGLKCWVDDDGNSYGQCQFGAPFGFELILVGQGGPGRGQGRKELPPHLKKVTKGVRLTEWVWDWLDAQDDPRGTMLEEALVKVHKLQPPTAG